MLLLMLLLSRKRRRRRRREEKEDGECTQKPEPQSRYMGNKIIDFQKPGKIEIKKTQIKK